MGRLGTNKGVQLVQVLEISGQAASSTEYPSCVCVVCARQILLSYYCHAVFTVGGSVILGGLSFCLGYLICVLQVSEEFAEVLIP